jgi:hypothetical protein
MRVLMLYRCSTTQTSLGINAQHKVLFLNPKRSANKKNSIFDALQMI